MQVRHICSAFAITLSLLAGACQPSPLSLPPAQLQTHVTSATAVQGQVIWQPDFTTQATVNDIQAQATVSLIYPSNHPTFANQTIATGLTTSTGAFIINPDSHFTPAADTVFVLEASKRVGGPGSDLLSLRTYLRWTGSTWTSITGPTIQINALTTAITIMDHYDNSFVPGDTIGSVSGGVPGSLGHNAGSAITPIRDLVTQALAEAQDPAHFIYHDGDSYQRRSVNSNHYDPLINEVKTSELLVKRDGDRLELTLNLQRTLNGSPVPWQWGSVRISYTLGKPLGSPSDLDNAEPLQGGSGSTQLPRSQENYFPVFVSPTELDEYVFVYYEVTLPEGRILSPVRAAYHIN